MFKFKIRNVYKNTEFFFVLNSLIFTISIYAIKMCYYFNNKIGITHTYSLSGKNKRRNIYYFYVFKLNLVSTCKFFLNEFKNGNIFL